jgi:hypothetical protein
LRFTPIHCWGTRTSGLLRRVVAWFLPDVSKKRTVFNRLTEHRLSSDVDFVFKWLACTCTNAHGTQSVHFRRLFVLLSSTVEYLLQLRPSTWKDWLGGYCTAVTSINNEVTNTARVGTGQLSTVVNWIRTRWLPTYRISCDDYVPMNNYKILSDSTERTETSGFRAGKVGTRGSSHTVRYGVYTAVR